MGLWDALLRTRAESWIYYQFKPAQVEGQPVSKPLVKGTSYANFWLRSARVVNVRSGLKRFYGTVHSYVSYLPRNESGVVEISTVTTPSNLKNIDPRNLDRVVSLNHRLLGPVVYAGTDLTLEVGLFSIEESDLVAPYLDLLKSISDLAGVGVLNAALTFAAPIKDGINGLLNGEGDSILEIGLSRTYPNMETGFYLVMRAPESSIDPANLTYRKSDGRVLGGDGKLVKDFPYFVLEIAETLEKEDWARIYELKRQYDLIKDSIIRGDSADALAGHRIFSRIALASNELTSVDAERLVRLVRAEIDRTLGETTTQSQGATPTVRSFEELDLYGDSPI